MTIATHKPRVSITASGARETTGPACLSCYGTQYIVLAEMAKGLLRAECKSCGETQYIPRVSSKNE